MIIELNSKPFTVAQDDLFHIKTSDIPEGIEDEFEVEFSIMIKPERDEYYLAGDKFFVGRDFKENWLLNSYFQNYWSIPHNKLNGRKITQYKHKKVCGGIVCYYNPGRAINPETGERPDLTTVQIIGDCYQGIDSELFVTNKVRIFTGEICDSI